MTDLATIVKTDDDVYKTLLESTKAIPWKIDWATMQFAYIGPQIESLLGWSPQSWATVDDWAARMHEDDRERVVNFCVTQSKGGFDHEADYRALTKDGRHVWLRDVVHVVRNLDGSVNSLVGFMFDISERKIAEEQLAALQKELEILSFVDGLTGIANRRRFDQVMKTEWANARRNSQPLSLVMVDIDHFKAYNDHYGHLQGDESLKRAAQALSAAATRPRDAVARFGGEEFALILPESDAASAQKIAARCRSLMFKEQIAHAASPVSQILTLSFGVGTVVPTQEGGMMEFIDAVDRQLYQAKQQGRDRIAVGA